MPELLEVVQPGVFPWWILWLALIPFVVGITLTVLGYDYEGGWAASGAGTAALAALIMIVVGVTIQGENNNAVTSRALQDSGFQEISYDNNGEFDAVWDGERVKGLLVFQDKVDDTVTYQIVIIPPVTK